MNSEYFKIFYEIVRVKVDCLAKIGNGPVIIAFALELQAGIVMSDGNI
jgi:hypothetical protein